MYRASTSKRRSPLRVRDAKRLPRRWMPIEVVALLESLRTWRDRAIAGLMVFCGLRSAEVLALDVVDVDIGGRWLKVSGKGDKERRVPLDVDVAGVIQTYLLAERPDTGQQSVVHRCEGADAWPAVDAGGVASDLSLSPRHLPASLARIRTRCGTRSAPRWPRPASISR